MRDAAKAGIMEFLQASILKVFVKVHSHSRAAFVIAENYWELLGTAVLGIAVVTVLEISEYCV